QLHRQLYGYVHCNREIEIIVARVELVARITTSSNGNNQPFTQIDPLKIKPAISHSKTTAYFSGRVHQTAVYLREQLSPGDQVNGPAIVCEPNSTLVIDPDFAGTVLAGGEILITDTLRTTSQSASVERTDDVADPISIELFNNLFASIAEQMGVTLQ